jgi:hypothetical protein
MAENVVQRIKQLDQERSQLVGTVKKEALARAHQAMSDLNALGFNYQLVEKGRGAAPKMMRQPKDAPCPVCRFKTSPPHDARKHRGQGKRKRPFTAAQLKEFDLERA